MTAPDFFYSGFKMKRWSSAAGAKAEESGRGEYQSGGGDQAAPQDVRGDAPGEGAGRDGGHQPDGDDPGQHQTQPAGVQIHRVARHLEDGIEDPGEGESRAPEYQSGERQQHGIQSAANPARRTSRKVVTCGQIPGFAHCARSAVPSTASPSARSSRA